MTQKEFKNLFDSIRCSEAFTARMEEQLSNTPDTAVFSDTASGVGIAQSRGRWMRYAGLAACLLLVVGGACFFLRQEKLPSVSPAPGSSETTTTETKASTQTHTVTTAVTAQVIVTQLADETFRVLTETQETAEEASDTATEITAQTNVQQTSAPQTSAQEIVMSDPTKPAETQTLPPDTTAAVKTTTTTVQMAETVQTTTAADAVLPDAEYDRSIFPMRGLETAESDIVLTAGYHYFQAAYELDGYVVTSPYRNDYMNVQNRSFEEDGRLWFPVTEQTVTCVADVQKDFYEVYAADQDSTHLAQNYRDMPDGLYFSGVEGIMNFDYSGYHITLDEITDTQIRYTCYSHVRGENIPHIFRLVKEPDGWKVGEYTNPQLP